MARNQPGVGGSFSRRTQRLLDGYTQIAGVKQDRDNLAVSAECSQLLETGRGFDRPAELPRQFSGSGNLLAQVTQKNNRWVGHRHEKRARRGPELAA